MDELDDLNPRASLGGNNPPVWALIRMLATEENVSAVVTDFLADEFKQWPATVAELLEEARALPREIASKEDREKFPPIIKRLRDTAAKIDALHTAQKDPFYRGGQAVDQFFFGMIDRLQKRSKTSNPGAADVLGKRLTAYDDRILAEERERRRLEAQEAARVAEEARKKAEQQAAEAEAARLAAERARNPVKVEEKKAIATEQEQKASAAVVEANVAAAAAEAAYVTTLAKPADIMRSRGEDGTLSTMKQETYAEIEDRTKLDIAKLAAYLPIKALETALNAWAKSTDYRVPMEGARIGRRNKTVVR